MFDTHCHLNFSRFKKNVEEVIQKAHEAGVNEIVIPGTDVPTSQKALELAIEHDGIFCAIGIHPHHVYEAMEKEYDVDEHLKEIELLLNQEKVVAVGEVGMDRHEYKDTKYQEYNVDESFIEKQKILFEKQVQLAITYNKSLIIHNREAKGDLLPILSKNWSSTLEGHAVFHCCEPDEELLTFAKDHNMFIGVDGDITYFQEKQDFIKKVPLEMLVLETDSPFLLPEPLRSQKLFPNAPYNLPLIAEFIAKIKGVSVEELAKIITENARSLFEIKEQ